MIKKSAMLGLVLAVSVVTHLAVGLAGRTIGQAEGYNNGVRDGHASFVDIGSFITDDDARVVLTLKLLAIRA